MLIAIPMAAVVMSSITIVLAVVSNDGTVADDYYRRGLEINRSLQRDRVAADYDLNASLQIDSERQRVRVRMRAGRNFELPSRLLLQLSHATRSGSDQRLVLHGAGGGFYEAGLQGLSAGRWYITLSHEAWRLNGVLNIPAQSEVDLLHDPAFKTKGAAGGSAVL